MQRKGSLYVGLILMGFGGVFLLATATNGFGGWLGRVVGWGGLWPLIILLVASCFWLPILIWSDRRQEVAGLAVPGTIIGVNGLMLLYQNWSGDWDSWVYLWPMEIIAVALGLLALYWLSEKRPRDLLVASYIVGGIGVAFFAIFASVFGGVFRLIGPVVLIGGGIAILLRGLGERSKNEKAGHFD